MKFLKIFQLILFQRYIVFWKQKFKDVKVEDVCFTIKTNTAPNDKGSLKINLVLLKKNLKYIF